MKQSKVLLVGAISAAFPAAFAQDVDTSQSSDATSPTYADMDFSQRWAGIYVGLNAGGIGHFASHKGYEPAGVSESDSWPSQTGEAFGELFGAQIGYNFQHENLVVGVEADFGVSTAGSEDVFEDGYVWRQRTGIDALGTARLRIGYAFDRAMIYATGGLAVGKVKDAIQAGDFFGSYSWSSGSRWKLGYVVGAGAEVAINDKWSIKGEGLFYDLGKEDHESILGNGDTYAWGSEIRSQGVVGRLGLNYRF